MAHRHLLTVVLVASLALAGCSALPIWDGGGAAPTPGPEEPPGTTSGVPTADPGAEGGAAPDVAYPDGYGPDGIADADVALQNHVGTLGRADSYTFTYDAVISASEAETTIGVVHHADNVDRLGYEIRIRQDAALVAYFEDDTVYVRNESSGEVRYNSTDREYRMSRFTGYQYVDPLLANVAYQDAEVVETDNGTFYHYASDRVTDPGSILRSDVDEEGIDRFDVAIVVDEDGVVRHARFVVEADRNVTVTMNVGEIGSTNVSRPQWYEEAKNS